MTPTPTADARPPDVQLLYHATSRRKAALILAEGFRDEPIRGLPGVRGVWLYDTTEVFRNGGGGEILNSHHQETLVVALGLSREELEPYQTIPPVHAVPAQVVNRYGAIRFQPRLKLRWPRAALRRLDPAALRRLDPGNEAARQKRIAAIKEFRARPDVAAQYRQHDEASAALRAEAIAEAWSKRLLDPGDDGDDEPES